MNIRDSVRTIWKKIRRWARIIARRIHSWLTRINPNL